jgi:ABC-type phosphate/phosphonate transport system substrate-binding protein
MDPARVAHPWRISLPMYNLPEMRGANAAFWTALKTELQRRGFEGVPATLDFERRPVPQEIEHDTLITQVCGYPLQTIFRGQAHVLGAPVYSAAHCHAARHAGVFLVHRDSRFHRLADLRGCRFVYNSRHSNSGMNLPRLAIAEIADGRAPFFASIAETHTQPGNIERVAGGEADATCVDCVTYAFFCRHRPKTAERVRVLAVTQSTPSIPFVTSIATPDDVKAGLRDALSAAARSAEWRDARAGLMLSDVVPADIADYACQLQCEQVATRLGYSELR